MGKLFYTEGCFYEIYLNTKRRVFDGKRDLSRGTSMKVEFQHQSGCSRGWIQNIQTTTVVILRKNIADLHLLSI